MYTNVHSCALPPIKYQLKQRIQRMPTIITIPPFNYRAVVVVVVEYTKLEQEEEEVMIASTVTKFYSI